MSMKKIFFCIALAMCSLCVNAQRECSDAVINCLDKAMHLSDLQAARSDLRMQVIRCDDDSNAALMFYKKIRDVEIRIANLTYELREAVLTLSEEEQNCDEMEFVSKILDDESK